MAAPTTPNVKRNVIAQYKSSYGPKYHYQTNINGLTGQKAMRLALKSGAFGAVAGFALIFYTSGIPRVQQDILQKIPYVRNHFIHEIPASDNPF
ncbi:hypothetical protein P8C59_000682 [Phyllachora maydis]|uniref:Cytochrome b-c1 complex subunit 10 n=1 Tax=Phyllachora maydis TaxID=1825666 RepID=A0AAD9HWL2_9PEZI|nr:hypothetical protein P8C59_000682 [Phyllachora maydis]